MMDVWESVATMLSNVGAFVLGVWCLKWAIEHGYAVVHRKHRQSPRSPS